MRNLVLLNYVFCCRLVSSLEGLEKRADASDEAAVYCDVLGQTIEKFHSEESWWPLKNKLMNVYVNV